jgi:hypothetical protein
MKPAKPLQQLENFAPAAGALALAQKNLLRSGIIFGQI